MLRTHDDWERLVGAVLKRQQLWELFHADSRSPSVLSEASSSSDHNRASFREIDTSSASSDQNLVLVSDFVPAFNLEDANLNSLELLGTGAYGNTYASDVSDGVKIVVKRINKSISVSEEQFKRSMDVVRRIRHENVVSLRAYYCSKDEKLMMYDYYSQGSVYHLLHGHASEIPPQVSWETRLKIAIGAARGLASIHAQYRGKLVHGNIKSTNIFLNNENYGSISDFGMIYLITAMFRQNERNNSTLEAKNTRNVSQESDVYSFGILLFELLTRQPSVQFLGGSDVVDLVKLMKSVKSTNLTSKADLIHYVTVRQQMVRVLQIGISCVAKPAKKRPKMSEVAKMLEELDIYSATKRHDLVFVNRNDVLSGDPFDVEDLLRGCRQSLGSGTYGSSYTVSLKNGMVARVKRIKNVTVSFEEFKQHMEIIGKIKHEGCAKVTAYYFSMDEVLLVYDHFIHESLTDLIHGKGGPRKPLAWDARLNIALTLAKAIVHIHSLDGSKLVHGNIRSSNILVNGYSSIITDTALWKVKEPLQSTVLRRQGYLAPEVKDTRDISQASDVYSFGVVLLELIMRGRYTVLGSSLVSLVRDNVLRKLAYTVLVPKLKGYDATTEVLQLAKDCVEDAPERRPTMYVVAKRLEQISGICEEESEPSMQSDSEDVRPWIGSSRLEDALEFHLSRLTIIQQR